MTEFLCGSRGTSRLSDLKNPDRWCMMRDGSRTCSYCGSLHPEDFHEICVKYAAGEEGYRFDTTDKRYKVYSNRPGVKNASEGGIKFYTWHAAPRDDPRIEEYNIAWAAAHDRFVKVITERYK